MQKKLLKFFVLEVTASSAADLLEISPNSAALFYHKIIEVMLYHLSFGTDEVFDGKIELDGTYSNGHRSFFLHPKTTRSSYLQSLLKIARVKRYSLLLKRKLS
ncbi:hypothetical protein A1D26_07255 [Ursidibacter maritimus]|nr:hypothetical protein A1D26_07255 [Ursidibacter maritimus]